MGDALRGLQVFRFQYTDETSPHIADERGDEWTITKGGRNQFLEDMKYLQCRNCGSYVTRESKKCPSCSTNLGPGMKKQSLSQLFTRQAEGRVFFTCSGNHHVLNCMEIPMEDLKFHHYNSKTGENQLCNFTSAYYKELKEAMQQVKDGLFD